VDRESVCPAGGSVSDYSTTQASGLRQSRSRTVRLLTLITSGLPVIQALGIGCDKQAYRELRYISRHRIWHHAVAFSVGMKPGLGFGADRFVSGLPEIFDYGRRIG
jgi:hypothetical protein